MHDVTTTVKVCSVSLVGVGEYYMHGACRPTGSPGKVKLSISFVKTQAALDSRGLVMYVAIPWQPES